MNWKNILKNQRPDYPDLDGDGDTEEPMVDALETVEQVESVNKEFDELDARMAESDRMELSGFKRRADDMIARAKQVRNEAADLYNEDGEFGFEHNMKKLDDAIQEYIKDILDVKNR